MTKMKWNVQNGEEKKKKKTNETERNGTNRTNSQVNECCEMLHSKFNINNGIYPLISITKEPNSTHGQMLKQI